VHASHVIFGVAEPNAPSDRKYPCRQIQSALVLLRSDNVCECARKSAHHTLTPSMQNASNSHPAQLLWFATAYNSGAHIVQLFALVAACSPENFPTPHGVHSAVPAMSLYVPTGQCSQRVAVVSFMTAVTLPAYPTSHKHSIVSSYTTLQCEFAGHVLQSEITYAPRPMEFVPNVHGVQV